MKVKLTERQVNMLKSSLNEGPSNQYTQNMDPHLHYPRLKYKGLEINDIRVESFPLHFNIEIEARSWGIKSISLTNFSGPSSIKVVVEAYTHDDQLIEEEITLELPWENVKVYKGTGSTFIGVEKDIEIELGNEPDGGLYITQMSLDIYQI